MTVLLIVGIVIAPFALYAADRLIKMRAQARKLRTMNERLVAATAKADEQEERRQAVVAASVELTSVVPAIQLPPPSLPGLDSPGPETPESGRDRAVTPDHASARKPEHASARPARRGPHSGEHAASTPSHTALR